MSTSALANCEPVSSLLAPDWPSFRGRLENKTSFRGNSASHREILGTETLLPQKQLTVLSFLQY